MARLANLTAGLARLAAQQDALRYAQQQAAMTNQQGGQYVIGTAAGTGSPWTNIPGQMLPWQPSTTVPTPWPPTIMPMPMQPTPTFTPPAHWHTEADRARFQKLGFIVDECCTAGQVVCTICSAVVRWMGKGDERHRAVCVPPVPLTEVDAI